MKNDFNSAVKKIKTGGVGVIPTDTIYGMAGNAFSKKAVARIYVLGKRNSKKPLIMLISSLKDISLFGIKVNPGTRRVLSELWPGKVSIILPCPDKKFKYLHRGTKSLAFRLPKNKKLTNFLKKTGPLVAPSANPEGSPPARNIKEAQKYFSDSVDFYVNGGKLDSVPSTLVSLENGKIKILRKGAGKIKIVTTLCLIHKGDKILLGMKKRGFGEGRWNGFGGKIGEGETVGEAALREFKEEAGILPVDMVKRGVITFRFKNSPEVIEVHFFSASDFSGEVCETEEMRPQWFLQDELPFSQMWPDDQYWFPLFLSGKNFKGEFHFLDNDTILDYTLKEI